MRISTKGRYSLEALLFLSLIHTDVFASIRQISEHTGISDGYLEQLFIPLKKAGFIRGTRGPTGGYLLGREPTEIRVGDLLRCVEGSMVPVACLSSETCELASECCTRPVWQELHSAITTCVDSITIADLATAWRQQEGLGFTI